MKFTVAYDKLATQGLYTSGRGEERWYLNATAALLAGGHEVGFWGKHWPEGLATPEGLLDDAPESFIEDSVFLIFNKCESPLPVPKAKYYIYNYFMNAPRYDNFPDNCSITQCYDVPLFRERFNSFGDRYFHLPNPTLESVVRDTTPFDNELILSTSKHLFDHLGGDYTICRKAIEWMSETLELDDNLSVVFLTDEEDILPIMNKPETEPLKKFEGRVQFWPQVSWRVILGLYKRTKFIVNTGHFNMGFSSTLMEAAAFGIPTVGYKVGPFGECPGSMTIDDSFEGDKFCSLMDKLFYNRELYEEKGNLYRNFVDSNYTYKVFTNKLLERF